MCQNLSVSLRGGYQHPDLAGSQTLIHQLLKAAKAEITSVIPAAQCFGGVSKVAVTKIGAADKLIGILR